MVPLLRYVAAISESVKLYKPRNEEDWSGIIWPGGHQEVPKDSPQCGWKGELCQDDEGLKKTSQAAIIISVALTITLILIGLIAFDTTLSMIEPHYSHPTWESSILKMDK